MVVYDLICEAGHTFEGWFKNQEDWLAQQEAQMVACPVCDSIHVSKQVTASKLTRKSNTQSNAPLSEQGMLSGMDANQYNQVQQFLTKAHEHIEKNYKDVGSNFAKQALDMHNGNLEKESIRGVATAEEVKTLKEEGVSALPLPPKAIDKSSLN